MQNLSNLRELLRWHVESGVDETMGSTTTDYLKARDISAIRESALHEPHREYQIIANSNSPAEMVSMPKAATKSVQSPSVKPLSAVPFPAEALAQSTRLANEASTLDELKAAVMGFEGCALKRSAKNTIFADGNPAAPVMVIGEAPGEQEDEQGIPFCGKSGQLLDNVLRSIGLTRAENFYITNTIFWRPPGNRTPTPEEVAICAPFVQKHIALKNPKLLILAGAVAGSVLGVTDSVSKMRGKFHSYTNPYLSKEIDAVVIYHPSYLLRSPGQKAAAWKDMQMIQEFLEARS